MSASALVSVVIRTLGRSSLEQAIASIARQTYDAIQVVVVDATGKGLPAPAAGRFPVRLFSEGRPLARAEAANVGLAAAEGRYAMLLDDDDWIYPDHVEGLAQMLEDEHLGRAAYAGVECIDSSSGEPKVTRVFNDPFDPLRLLFVNYIPVHAMLFARSLFEPDGCRFDPDLPVLEDWDFWQQVAEHTPIRHRDKITAAYRVPGGSSLYDHDSPDARRALDRLFVKWSARAPRRVAQLLDGIRDETLSPLRALRQQLEHEGQHAQALRQQLEQGRHELEQLAAHRRRAEQELVAVRESLSEQTRLAAARERQLRALAAALSEREAHVAEIRASLSWRLTGPLRAAHRWFTARGAGDGVLPPRPGAEDTGRIAGDEAILDARRVLVVAAHADDETLGCGGTIALLAAAGAQVDVIIVSDGAGVTPPASLGPGDVVAARQREADEAGRLLGVRKVHFLGLPDGALGSCIERMSADIERIAADSGAQLVLVPSPLDHHPDHRAVSRAAIALAGRRSELRLALYQVYGTLRFNALVNITGVMSVKIDALRCYRVSLYGDPEPFVEAAKGSARSWSLYRRKSGYYEAFLVLAPDPPVSEARVVDWLTYGEGTAAV